MFFVCFCFLIGNISQTRNLKVAIVSTFHYTIKCKRFESFIQTGPTMNVIRDEKHALILKYAKDLN